MVCSTASLLREPQRVWQRNSAEHSMSWCACPSGIPSFFWKTGGLMLAMREALRVRISNERRNGCRHLEVFSKVGLHMQVYNFIHIGNPTIGWQKNNFSKFSVWRICATIGGDDQGYLYPIEFHFLRIYEHYIVHALGQLLRAIHA